MYVYVQASTAAAATRAENRSASDKRTRWKGGTATLNATMLCFEGGKRQDRQSTASNTMQVRLQT